MIEPSELARGLARRCGACAGIMVHDKDKQAGPVLIASAFACEACASETLVLSPVGYGGLLGFALASLIAAAWFFLGKETNGWIVGTLSAGLALFFGFLAVLRWRDARANPPIG